MSAVLQPVDVTFAGDGAVAAGALIRVIDGSGLSVNNAPDATHRSSGDYYSTTWVNNDTTATLRFDLGSVQRIDGVYLWNFLLEQWNDLKNRGVKDFTIDFSTNGTTYTGSRSFTATSSAPNGSAESAQLFTFAPVGVLIAMCQPSPWGWGAGLVSAMYVRMRLLSSLGDGLVGLSEVRFRREGAPPVNRAPVAVNDSAVATAGTAVTVNVLANDTDPDSDPLTLASATATANGSASIINNRIVYTARPGFQGVDTVDYTVADPAGLTAAARLSITVSAPATTGAVITPVAVTALPNSPTIAGNVAHLINNTGLSTPFNAQSTHGSTGDYYGSTWVTTPGSGVTLEQWFSVQVGAAYQKQMQAIDELTPQHEKMKQVLDLWRQIKRIEKAEQPDRERIAQLERDMVEAAR